MYFLGCFLGWLGRRLSRRLPHDQKAQGSSPFLAIINQFEVFNFLNVIMLIVHISVSQGGQVFQSFCQRFRQLFQSHNGIKCTSKCLIYTFCALSIVHNTIDTKSAPWCIGVHAVHSSAH